jgi:hypothetical protein
MLSSDPGAFLLCSGGMTFCTFYTYSISLGLNAYHRRFGLPTLSIQNLSFEKSSLVGIIKRRPKKTKSQFSVLC